jgi:CubicO group peptidase (beta-lactamase class C family)
MKAPSHNGFGLDKTYILDAMKDWDVPGLSIAIVKDQATVFSQGFGRLHHGKQSRVDRDTLFTIGSCTKAFTTVALAMLVEEGKCSWDDPVVKYVPKLRMYTPELTATLTLKDVVTHQSGVEDGAITGIPARTLSKAISLLRSTKPAYPLRGAFSYNNTLFAALAPVVEKVSGMPWEMFLEERILSPIGMNTSFATTVTMEAAGEGENRALPHHRPGDADHVSRMRVRNLDFLASSAGLQANATDMAAWLKCQLGTAIGSKVSTLVSNQTLKAMHSEQLELMPNGFTLMMHPGSTRHGYGMAWFVRQYGGAKIVQHGGYVDGYTSFALMCPERGFGVVVLTNMHNSLLPFALAYRVSDAYLGVAETDWSGYFLAKRAEHRNKVSPHDEENAREDKRLALASKK